jgi:uncharacterized protein (DUF2237 family)
MMATIRDRWRTISATGSSARWSRFRAPRRAHCGRLAADPTVAATPGERTWAVMVCAVMTSAFLEFSKSRGNDLSTPLPELGFPELKPGDRWCLCAPRWQEAFEANQAPRVILRATTSVDRILKALDLVRSSAIFKMEPMRDRMPRRKLGIRPWPLACPKSRSNGKFTAPSRDRPARSSG